MCGLAGIITNQPIDFRTIEAMTTCLVHRGPDAQGISYNATRTIALGHTRLSIVDLSEQANQPFHSRNGRFTAVFNGEIYNFRKLKHVLTKDYNVFFRTNSDTEVIVEAFAIWGEKMVSQLDGMFSIALLDNHENTVWFFRDRIGKKPLYYFESDDLFAFASEIKSLLRHPVIGEHKEINYDSVSSFLHLGYIPGPATIYHRIHKFPSAHSGHKKQGINLVLKRYWTSQTDEKIVKGENETKTSLSSLLFDSTQKRLLADVPIGAFLSGGTDSSLVTAIAARALATPIQTFSIGFTEQKFNESGYASAVAKHLSTNHTEYILEEKEAVDLFEFCFDHFDEPFADTSAIPTMLVSKLARSQVKVALTGDGGDELFQGYGSYAWADRLSTPIWKIAKPLLHQAFSISGIDRYRRIAQLLKPVKIGGLRSHIFSQENYFFSQSEIFDQLLVDGNHKIFTDDQNGLPSGLRASEEQALFDLHYYLKDDLLVKVDRASMAFGLECRSPLLDYRVVEFALSLDYKYKVRNGEAKWILKQLLREYLPPDLIDRPKWGFSVPLEKWLKNDLHYLIETYLSENSITEIGLFNNQFVQNLRYAFLNGHSYLYNRIWVIIVLQKWFKQNR